MKKYGLQFDTIKQEDYYLGGGFIGTEEIQPDGQWDEFLPPEEIQNTNDVETMACTIFGTINCIEILFNKMFHEEKDFAERYNAILAGIGPAGGSPHNAGECIRKEGLIDQTSLPFNNTIKSWDDFYSPDPMTANRLVEGQKWARAYQFFHEYVFTGSPVLEEKIRLIKDALRRSPVGASVFAWACDENGIYYKAGPENHWICIYGYRDDIRAWKVFDSYTNSYKLYSFDSEITQAKLYWLKKKPPVKEYWFCEIAKNVLNFIRDLIFRIKK